MAITLHDWKTIRELRLCTAAGLLNPMEFKILLAPMVFLDQGDAGDDEEDSIADDLRQIKKNKKSSSEKEELPPAIGFHVDSEEEDD